MTVKRFSLKCYIKSQIAIQTLKENINFYDSGYKTHKKKLTSLIKKIQFSNTLNKRKLQE